MKYNFKGLYAYGGTRGTFTGRIDIEGTVLTGTLQDIGPNAPEQDIVGSARTDGTTAILKFVKLPPGFDLTSTLYQLECEPHKDLCGLYRGTWQVLPRELKIAEVLKTAGIEEVIRSLREHNYPEMAQLILSKR